MTGDLFVIDQGDDHAVWQRAEIIAWDHRTERGQAKVSGALVPIDAGMLTGGLTATLHAGMAIDVELDGNAPRRFRQAR